MTTTIDWVADCGAPTDGTSSCVSAFAFLNNYMQTHNDVILTVPAHTYKPGGTVYWADSAGAGSKLVVQATGGRPYFDCSASGFMWFGGRNQEDGYDASSGFFPDKTHHARIATVAAGSSTVLLLTPPEASRFAVGRYVAVTGLTLQPGGFPSNSHYFEYHKITDITGGVFTLDAPLTYAYLSTWPAYSDVNNDFGGPGTIYLLSASWDMDVRYIGLRFNNGPDADMGGPVKKVRYSDVVVSGNRGPSPSGNDEHIIDADCDLSACFIEVDKLVRSYECHGTVNQIQFQSSSVGLVTMTNPNITTMQGTPKRAVITGGSIGSLSVGAFAYGATEEITATGCAISSITDDAVNETASGAGVETIYTMVNGAIIAPSGSELRWAIPGGYCMFGGAKPCEMMFRILSVTETGGSIYVQTNLAGGFPAVPRDSGKLYINVHPAPRCTFRSCTGSSTVLSLNNAPARAPLYSYLQQTVTGAGLGHGLWGRVTAISYAVNVAYSGATTPLKLELAEVTIKPDLSSVTYDPFVDARTTGTRNVILAGSTTLLGADATLDLPDANSWMADGVSMGFTTDISGQSSGSWPSIVITMTTDQGILPVGVVPLRLRLHS